MHTHLGEKAETLEGHECQTKVEAKLEGRKTAITKGGSEDGWQPWWPAKELF